MKSIFEHKANVTSKDYSYQEIATDILAKDYSKEKLYLIIWKIVLKVSFRTY